MKVILSNGAITLTSENNQEALKLLALTSKSDRAPRPYINAWKGKHLKPCVTCGKPFKNMKLHMMRKHAPATF